jgi:hypothetical protein
MPAIYPDPVPPGPNAKPTPTQAENDAAMMGNSVQNKTVDGSPADPYENYWSGGEPGDTQPIVVLDSISPTSGAAGTVVLIATAQHLTDDAKIVFAGVVQTTLLNGPKTQVTSTISGVTAGAKLVKIRNKSGDSNSKTFTAA